MIDFKNNIILKAITNKDLHGSKYIFLNLLFLSHDF